MKVRDFAYGGTGAEWLHELPLSWETKRLKYIATINDDKLADDEDPLRPVAYVDIGTVDLRSGIGSPKEMVFEESPSRARRLVRDGDTIVSTVRTYLRAIAPVRKPPSELVVSTGFAVVRPTESDPAFTYWTLCEHGFVEEMVARSVGVSYPAIKPSQIGLLPVPQPPLEEQPVIAAYLDREAARIDKLIMRQESLIERLDEYRTALITRTVTKGLPREVAESAGLDPEPNLKDSGAEWLGEVPEHWQLVRIRRVAWLKAGDAIAADDITEAGPYAVFGGNGIRGFTDRYSHELTAVLVGRQGAHCGNVHIATERFWASEHAVVAEPLGDVNAYWLADLLDAMMLNQYSMAAAQPGLSIDRVKDLLVPLIPVREQRAIVDYLDSAKRRIDALRAKVELLVERLSEYRSALISATVTGKIDVREAASAGSVGGK